MEPICTIPHHHTNTPTHQQYNHDGTLTMEASNSTEQQQQSATDGFTGEQQPPPQNLDNNPSPAKRARAEHDGELHNNNNNNNTSSGSNNDEDYFGNMDDEQLLQHMSEVDPGHSLQANLFTVYCSNECCRLLSRRGSNLWMLSPKLLRQHFDQHHDCSTKKPNANKIHKQLMLQQILLHDRLKSGTPSQATNMVDEIFPADCEKLPGSFVFCNKCGFFAKRHTNFDKHFGQQNKYNCRKAFHKRSGGTILVGANGIKCPLDIVVSVRNQTFELPYEHAKRQLPQTPPPIRRLHNVASIAAPTLNSNSIGKCALSIVHNTLIASPLTSSFLYLSFTPSNL